MSISAAQKMANARYRQKKRKAITADVPKEKGEQYQAFAARVGLSMSLLVQRGIEEFIQRHGGEALPRHPAPMESTPALPRHPARIEPNATQPAEQISANQRRLLDAVDQLPTDAQKSLLKFLQSLNAQQVNVATENKAENTAKNASVDNQEPI